ncbi:cation/h+ exchanger protein 1 [Plakobranchus ocellatus]|uniref:Cation/h+ exchanger protein 1 n=1 Tax=Plakobranchus ocellatus TaxID=259542 RepID=A0AAV3YAR2_9GAST|nr:cation/h+ exchanger protein 1 [Plakobranchus ocellatus]
MDPNHTKAYAPADDVTENPSTSGGQMAPQAWVSSGTLSDLEGLEGNTPTVIIIDDGTAERRRTPVNLRPRREALLKSSTDAEMEFEKSAVYIAENSIEAARISNNFKFGLKKWKSHVTSRPLITRSEIVQDLYADIDSIKEVKVTTFRPFNILYALLYGWWLALIYALIGAIMYITVIGADYGTFCWRMAGYFIWPFGKYVHQVHASSSIVPTVTYNSTSSANGQIKVPAATGHQNYSANSATSGSYRAGGETEALLSSGDNLERKQEAKTFCFRFWKRPSSYLWMLFGLLPLCIIHGVIFAVNWFFVISIPTAKLNGKMLTKILFLPPEEVHIGNSGRPYMGPAKSSEIIMYSHQSVNFYYYKYTIDGVNIILANLLVFVILSIVVGYFFNEAVVGGVTKCILSVLAVIPLTYYIGMAITSISAQSSFAVGAILNATFGSMVEVILFIIMLKKGKDTDQECYQELVKSSLTGAILCSILFIPGMSMVVGGFKFRTQKFNPRSANISASLLFVAILGVFAPTIFSKIFGSLHCHGCETTYDEVDLGNGGFSEPGKVLNLTDYAGFLCRECEQSLYGPHGDITLYNKHIKPMVYAISLILPVAYFIGLIFTMKTHSAHVFGEFEQELKQENGNNGHHGMAQWSKTKSTIILLLSAVAIALCADLISENIQPLLETSGISEYFIGVTMLSLVSELPEVVNGVQFALQNNVNLGIEIGCSTAIQVCLVQIPLLVLVNLIYPLGFYMVFNDVHLWTVVFAVIIINYIFQDGKSDYFQGSIVVFIYVLLMIMYFFMLTPEHAMCHPPPKNDGPPTTTPFPSFTTTT